MSLIGQALKKYPSFHKLLLSEQFIYQTNRWSHRFLAGLWKTRQPRAGTLSFSRRCPFHSSQACCTQSELTCKLTYFFCLRRASRLPFHSCKVLLFRQRYRDQACWRKSKSSPVHSDHYLLAKFFYYRSYWIS